MAAVCGPAHLALHRPHTKCLPFRVAELPGRGRGLVATRTIRARSGFYFIFVLMIAEFFNNAPDPRETVLTEAAALVGPSLLTAPVCPGCLAPARAPLLPCSECALPVCSPACAQSREHRLECKLLKENKVKVNITSCDTVAPIYSFILPYRLLMLRHASRDTWAR